MAIAVDNNCPISVLAKSATVQNVNSRTMLMQPYRFTGDKPYDSDVLSQQRRAVSVQLIAPQKKGGYRSLKRHHRQWKEERLVAWLHNLRS